MNGRTAFVTGATRGIGAATARRLAQEGANVVVTGRSVEDGEAVADEVGGLFVRMDITDEDQVIAAVETAEKCFGSIDILVNNAAPTDLVGNQRPIGDLDAGTWRDVLDVGLNGTFYATKHGVQALVRAGGGAIVNVSSAQAQRGTPFMPAYSASKGAIEALSRQVAVDYAEHGIRCNTVTVGFVNSGEMTAGLLSNPQVKQALEQTQLTRIGEPEDIAEVIAFLASDRAAFISGATVVADGGFSKARKKMRKPLNREERT